MIKDGKLVDTGVKVGCKHTGHQRGYVDHGNGEMWCAYPPLTWGDQQLQYALLPRKKFTSRRPVTPAPPARASTVPTPAGRLPGNPPKDLE